MNYGSIRVQETGEVIPEFEYRARWPTTSFAVDAAPPGTDRVVEVAPPATTRYERAVRGDAEQLDGQWQFAWTIAPALVPASVSMRNAQRILYREGLLTSVEAVIATMEGEEGDLARIDWARALTVERTDPIVLHLIPQLGKSELEIDHMFIDADLLG